MSAAVRSTLYTINFSTFFRYRCCALPLSPQRGRWKGTHSNLLVLNFLVKPDHFRTPSGMSAAAICNLQSAIRLLSTHFSARAVELGLKDTLSQFSVRTTFVQAVRAKLFDHQS